jgi:hypothetical protein
VDIGKSSERRRQILFGTLGSRRQPRRHIGAVLLVIRREIPAGDVQIFPVDELLEMIADELLLASAGTFAPPSGFG